MCEVFDYIFSKMKSSDVAMQTIQKMLYRQKKINRNVARWMVTSSVVIILNEMARQEQNRKIKRLEKEIAEIRRSEGEQK